VEELIDSGYTNREIFALFDSDGKGVIDVGMLQKGARETGSMMTRAEARCVYYVYNMYMCE
jgi:Ca2+-binding EF-hand superfamily protein